MDPENGFWVLLNFKKTTKIITQNINLRELQDEDVIQKVLMKLDDVKN